MRKSPRILGFYKESEVFDMLSKAGLIGLYQASNTRNKISSVYMISDEDTASLYVFVLFPGAYHDIYEIASLTAYTNIFIVPISLDPVFISDIYRLVNELTPIKHIVKVISPTKYTYANCNTLFLNSFVKGNTKSSFVYSNHGFIAFNWNEDDCTYPSRLNDIYCTFNNRRILLTSTKVDKERIIKLFENDQLDYVYVPWSKNPEYNSAYDDNFISLMDCERLKPYESKIVPYGFNDHAEMTLCREKYPNNFPVTIRHLFIKTTMESSMEDVVTWGEINMKPHEKPVNPYSYNSCNRIPPRFHGKPFPFIPHGYPPHMPPPKPYPYDGCKSCPLYNPPETNPEFNVTDVAISILDEYCPNFKIFAENCTNVCEDCKLKAYFETINSETPDTGDESGNGTGNTDDESGTSTETPTDTPDTTDETTDPVDTPTGTDKTENDGTVEDGSSSTNGTEDTTNSGESGESKPSDTTPSTEEPVDDTEQSASERLFG